MIEAVNEIAQLKFKIFQQLSSILPLSCILASNTSSISISSIASSCSIPKNISQNDYALLEQYKSSIKLNKQTDKQLLHDLSQSRCIGMHFMNPVPIMQLIEIINGIQTSLETIERTHSLAAQLNKITTMSQDRPGFIANRLLMPYINEAIFALQDNIASRDDIDTTMKLGCNMPMGPLQLADFIGLDTCLSIMNVLHQQLGDSKYRPAPLLRNYVEAGRMGKKTNRGFYDY